MGRRLVRAGLAVVMMPTVLTVTVGAGVAWANPAAKAAAGKVTCPVTGSGTFSPKLTLGGSPGGVKYTITAKSKDCTSNATVDGKKVTITGVTVTGSGYWNSTPPFTTGSSCASLPTDLLGSGQKMKYVWTSTPAIANTNITFKQGKPWAVNGPIFNFKLPGAAPAAVITASAGSFAPVAVQTWNVTTNIASNCVTGWGPYPNFTITGGTITVA